MLRETQGQFERASVILEAGTKIYSKRVDSTLSTTFRVRENLFRNDGGKGKKKTRTEEEKEEGEESGEVGKTTSKRNVSKRLTETKTLETKLSNITIDSAKNRRAGTVFQKMRQFFGVNSGGSDASGMLLNKLGVHSGCSLSLGSFAGITIKTSSSSSSSCEDKEKEEKNIDDESERKVVRLDELSAVIRRIAPNLKTDLPEVCPKLESFYRSIRDDDSSNADVQNDTQDDDEDDDVDFETGDLDAFDDAEREEAALENLMQDDEESDGMRNVNKNVSSNSQAHIDDRAEQERHFDALEIAIRGATLCNTVNGKAATSSSECNYDYFDRSWLRQQGSQWRRRRRMQWEKEQKQSNNIAVATAKAGKRKRRVAFFFNFSEKLSDEEVKSLEPTKTSSGKRAPHTWTQKTDDALVKIQQRLLLDDGDLEDDVSDVAKMGRLFLNPSIGLRDETSSSTSKKEDEEEKSDEDDFDGAVPDYDGGFDDDDDDGDVNYALDDKSSPLEFLDNFKASNLVQAEHKVEKQTIHYETVAKRVDVGRLKTSIWNSIETKVETVEKTSEAITLMQSQKEDESKEDESKEEEEDVDKTCCFKTVMEKLSSTREVPENVTVPFYFICTLHLANEHGLLLSHRDRLDEASKQDGMTSGASIEPAALSDLNDFIIVAPDESEWK